MTKGIENKSLGMVSKFDLGSYAQVYWGTLCLFCYDRRLGNTDTLPLTLPLLFYLLITSIDVWMGRCRRTLIALLARGNTVVADGEFRSAVIVV